MIYVSVLGQPCNRGAPCTTRQISYGRPMVHDGMANGWGSSPQLTATLKICSLARFITATTYIKFATKTQGSTQRPLHDKHSTRPDDCNQTPPAGLAAHGPTNHHATRLKDQCLWTGRTGRTNLARGTRWTQNTSDNKLLARLPAVRQ